MSKRGTERQTSLPPPKTSDGDSLGPIPTAGWLHPGYNRKLPPLGSSVLPIAVPLLILPPNRVLFWASFSRPQMVGEIPPMLLVFLVFLVAHDRDSFVIFASQLLDPLFVYIFLSWIISPRISFIFFSEIGSPFMELGFGLSFAFSFL